MNTENKMYTCALCGKSYTNIIDRMACEQKCYAKQQEEEKKAAEAKKKVEQEAHRAKVTKAIDDAYAELQKYVEKYGTYRYGINDEALNNNNMSLGKFLNYFLF